MKKLPQSRHAAHKLLVAMLDGPGTFYQICERANVDVESKRAETGQRILFDGLVHGGHASFSGFIYFITTAARLALVPPAPFVGQVAGAAYRGPNCATPVTIVRRAAGARA